MRRMRQGWAARPSHCLLTRAWEVSGRSAARLLQYWVLGAPQGFLTPQPTVLGAVRGMLCRGMAKMAETHPAASRTPSICQG